MTRHGHWSVTEQPALGVALLWASPVPTALVRQLLVVLFMTHRCCPYVSEGRIQRMRGEEMDTGQ